MTKNILFLFIATIIIERGEEHKDEYLCLFGILLFMLFAAILMFGDKKDNN